MLVTISGLPGSGKTTVARLVSQRLGLRHVYAGDIFRRQAAARGMSLEEYNHLAEHDQSIDRELDRQMEVEAKHGDAVLEGRLAAFVVERAGVEALRVFLDAAEPVRAERLAKREGGRAEEMFARARERESSDARRYQEIYGVDYHDPARYDLVIATDDRTPEEVAEEIVAAAERRFGKPPA